MSRPDPPSLISPPAKSQEFRGSGAYREVCTRPNAWLTTQLARIGRRRRVDPRVPRRLCDNYAASEKVIATSGRGMPHWPTEHRKLGLD